MSKFFCNSDEIWATPGRYRFREFTLLAFQPVEAGEVPA